MNVDIQFVILFFIMIGILIVSMTFFIVSYKLIAMYLEGDK